MAQITSGVRAILSSPHVYNTFQAIMGARRGRQEFAEVDIRAVDGDRVLDIGCGTGEIRPYLPAVDYVGFDISPDYIRAAQSKFGETGTFHCRLFGREDVARMPPADIVLAIGLLHHLDDGTAREFMELAKSALKPGGRLIALDPCLVEGQNPVARFLVNRDRGQNVRDEGGYIRLASSVFRNVSHRTRHTRWIPYTHFIMQCSTESPTM